MDATGTYLTDRDFTGVWLSDRPLDQNEGVKGSRLVLVDVPAGVIDPFEWIEEGKPYREFLVPAAILNQFPVRLAHED